MSNQSTTDWLRDRAIGVVVLAISLSLMGCNLLKKERAARKADTTSLAQQAASTQTWVATFAHQSHLHDQSPAKFSPNLVAQHLPKFESSPRSPIPSQFAFNSQSTDQAVQLASHSIAPEFSFASESVKVTAIDGQRVRSLGDCLRRFHESSRFNESIQVDYKIQDSSGESAMEHAIVVPRKNLLALLLSGTSDCNSACFQTETGSHYYIREGDVYASVHVDLQQATGIVRVVIELMNTGTEDRLLPADCFAAYAAQSLACLSADEALKRSCGSPNFKEKVPKVVGRDSFAHVSSQAGYLQLTDLSEIADANSRAVRPAFISAALKYPGPPLRGDAIALSGSLLQQQLVEAGETSSGWILFALPPDQDKDTTDRPIDIRIKLVNQEQTIRLMWKR